MHNLWEINPVGSVLLQNKLAKNFMVNEQADLIGFIDGSWKKTKDEEIYA